jgi:serine/alanine adding enzyme
VRLIDGAQLKSSSAAGRVVRSLHRDRWRAFVERHPQGSIFHTPEMFDVFARTRNHHPTVWATLDEGGDIRALMTPVAATTLGRPLHTFTTRMVGFGGPLLAPRSDSAAALLRLLQSYQQGIGRTALFTEFRNLADTSELAPTLATAGFRHELHLNFLVDLTLDEDALWLRIKSSARRNVEKARRLGVTIAEAEQMDIAEGYAVLRDVYSRIRVPLPDQSMFDAAHHVLAPSGIFRMLLARIGDRTIGVLTLLCYRDVAYYWYTGTLREDAQYRAGDLLVWHAMQLARAEGCRTLDFGGAGKPDEPYGVRDFKAKYGGRLVDFGRDTWVPSPVRLRLATMGYEKVRRFL